MTMPLKGFARHALPLSLLLVALGTGRADAAPLTYSGLCEASAAASLDAAHFVVASDEINILQVYASGTSKPLGRSIDLRDFIGEQKSDIEAAARIGDRIYWLSSQSPNSHGKKRNKRSIFFVSQIDGLVVSPLGRPYKDMGKALAHTLDIKPDTINIEGLASTGKNGLMIGLRAPLTKEGRAIVVPLANPADVTLGDADPDLGSPYLLDLDGRGIRSIDRTEIPDLPYLIVAGHVEDGGDFALYSWKGSTDTPAKLPVTFGKGLTPEALVVDPTTRTVTALSDDGSDSCSDDPTSKTPRRFATMLIQLPANP